MYIKLIKKKEYHLFLYYLNGRIVRRIMAFIRHFRLFSKRCPSCNGFKENGKKHSINDCIQTLLKRAIKDFNKKGSIENGITCNSLAMRCRKWLIIIKKIIKL